MTFPKRLNEGEGGVDPSRFWAGLDCQPLVDRVSGKTSGLIIDIPLHFVESFRPFYGTHYLLVAAQ